MFQRVALLHLHRGVDQQPRFHALADFVGRFLVAIGFQQHGRPLFAPAHVEVLVTPVVADRSRRDFVLNFFPVFAVGRLFRHPVRLDHRGQQRVLLDGGQRHHHVVNLHHLRHSLDLEAKLLHARLRDQQTQVGYSDVLASVHEQIQERLFVFEDINLVNDKGIQAVLKEVENDELALALKTASPELREKIFKNMSERAAQLIQEDMQYMGPVRVADVEGAQQRIVDIVRRLEDAGEIIISGRGGDKEMIV
ncbi:MAG: hypothetical protein HC828_16915 [Blastochloris sp.]|nr:hypothetical protein [Blastochloris sp.]